MRNWVIERVLVPSLWIGIAVGMILYALFASMVHANELPDSPAPKISVSASMGHAYGHPIRQDHWIMRPSTLAIFQAMAVIADDATTARFPKNAYEADPLVRKFLGPRPTWKSMIGPSIAEVGVSYLLAKKFPKLRWLQLGFTVTHATCAAHNARLE